MSHFVDVICYYESLNIGQRWVDSFYALRNDNVWLRNVYVMVTLLRMSIICYNDLKDLVTDIVRISHQILFQGVMGTFLYYVTITYFKLIT